MAKSGIVVISKSQDKESGKLKVTLSLSRSCKRRKRRELKVILLLSRSHKIRKVEN